MSAWLSPVNGIDAVLFFLCVLVAVGWLLDRERWAIRLHREVGAAKRWSARCIEAQGAVEQLRASVAAEIEARLDDAVQVALEAAEQQQSAHDRVEALARAIQHRLTTQGLLDACGCDEAHALLDQLGVPRRNFTLTARIQHALQLEGSMRTERALREHADAHLGAVPWEANADTLDGVAAVEGDSDA